MRSEGWKEVALSEVIEFNPRENLKKGTMAQKVSMADIEPFTRKVQRSSLEKYSSGSKFRNGDTLLARITPCLENGKTAYVDFLEEDEVAFGSTEFFVLREKKGISDKKFIYYLAISPQLRSIAINSMTGTSGRQRAQIDVLEKARFLLPPLVEQKKIASILSSLDEKIELNHQINQNLEEMAQAIFKSWFIDFEPFQDGEFVESELGMIPKGWEVKRIEEICDVLGGGTPKTKVDDYWNGNILWATPSDITSKKSPVIYDTSRKITEDGLNNSSTKLLPAKSILLTSRATIGYVVLAMKEICTNQGFINLICNKSVVSPYYMLFYLKSNKDRIIGMANGSTFLEVSRRAFRDMAVFVPPLEVIKEFDRIIKPLISNIYENELENETLSSLRDALLPKLMSGEIRVPLEENVTV